MASFAKGILSSLRGLSRPHPASSPQSRRRYALLITALFLLGYLFPLICFYQRSKEDSFSDAPRSGEAYVSDREFIDCVGERLSYKSDHPDRIPYMLIPVTMDYQDLKNFFCNVTAPMTYIMFINNGEFKPLRRLLDLVEARFPDYMNKNLFIRHHPENIGYASAVNEGLRHVMTYSVDEVPWIFITNADVRFAPSLVPTFVKAINKRTKGQEEVIRKLNAEVAAEAVTAAKLPNQRFTYRSSSLPIVTATSLPYRIRTMLPNEMRKQFAEHYGVFFPNHFTHMATFVISRLLLATVGLFDENYYPAYGEDHDYEWRWGALGFKSYFSQPGLFKHFENANLRVNADLKSRGINKYSAYIDQSSKFSRMNYQPFRLYYRREKWFPSSRSIEPENERQPLPFNGKLAVDMWVLDPKRRQIIWEIGEGKLCRRDYQLYNLSLLNFSFPSD